MRVLYIAGYGRSGSTLLGRLEADAREGVHVGEVTHVRRLGVAGDAPCTCGLEIGRCPYWTRVEDLVREPGGRVTDGGRALTLLEGLPGLLVPMRLLRPWVRRLPFSEALPGVSFRDGVRALSAAAGGLVVDGSKTTRLTANRPRLLAAAGLEVDLVLARRPVRDVVTSYVEAGRRRGIRRSRLRSAVVVRLGVALSRFAAAVCAASLSVPVRRTDLSEGLARLEGSGRRQWPRDHAIEGNRRRFDQEATS